MKLKSQKQIYTVFWIGSSSFVLFLFCTVNNFCYALLFILQHFHAYSKMWLCVPALLCFVSFSFWFFFCFPHVLLFFFFLQVELVILFLLCHIFGLCATCLMSTLTSHYATPWIHKNIEWMAIQMSSTSLHSLPPQK